MERKDSFPVGGPRQPVYDFLKRNGFVEANWTDKHWTRGALELHLYGTGSRARIHRTDTGETLADGFLLDAVDAVEGQ
jgi:hypothetical protein